MGKADIEFAYLADRVSRHVCSTQEAERFVSIAFKMLEALKAARKRIYVEMTVQTDRYVLAGMSKELRQIDAAITAAEPETGEGQ